jgi:hypothetical protein
MNLFFFVAFWVVLALALFLVAIKSGPKRDRKKYFRDTTRGRGLYYFGALLVIVALGVLIPSAIVAADKDRNDIPKAGVFNLTSQEERGRELFAERCKNCHTLKAANAVATVGPNLDQLRPPYQLVLFAIRNGAARGNGQMGQNLVTGSDAKAVAAFVAKAVGQQVPPQS